MAIVWFVGDKSLPTRGYKQADRDVDWCVKHLVLKRRRMSRLPGALIIGGARLTLKDESRYVVIEVSRDESDSWRAGYYLIKTTPAEARTRLECREADESGAAAYRSETATP